MDAVNECCTELFNVIKFKINYSCFLRDLEKTKYVLNVCQIRWKKSNHFAKSKLKNKIFSIFYTGEIYNKS